ncbi:MAG TPA: hypothetical protein VFV11_09570, partial [Solimonas sp.]|nr:hypothetical protein [Solimonas sp.]
FPGPAEGIEGAGFSANGRQVLIRGKDLQAQLWDRESGQPLQSFRGHEWKIADFDLASDGRLATASWDASLRVWEPASGRELARLYLPDDGAFFRVRFSADGQRLLAGEEHNSAKIWDLRDGRVTSLRGIAGGVFHVRWLADDRLALTASADGDVRVWDADDGRPLAVVAAVGGPVPIVRIDPAQRWLATTSRQDEQVGIWSLALERRTPETVAALLRCRSPWILGDEALEARRPPREDCRIDTHPKVTGAAP